MIPKKQPNRVLPLLLECTGVGAIHAGRCCLPGAMLCAVVCLASFAAGSRVNAQTTWFTVSALLTCASMLAGSVCHAYATWVQRVLRRGPYRIDGQAPPL